jgi:hypothetical protein
MSASDAGSSKNSPSSSEDDPLWIKRITEFLRQNACEFDLYDHMQIVFNRAGDQVVADYKIDGIKLK